MKYKYTALNGRNQKKEGAIEADSQAEATNKLREKGLIVQDLIQLGKDSDEPTSIWQMDLGGDIHTKKIKPKKVILNPSMSKIMLKKNIGMNVLTKQIQILIGMLIGINYLNILFLF